MNNVPKSTAHLEAQRSRIVIGRHLHAKPEETPSSALIPYPKIVRSGQDLRGGERPWLQSSTRSAPFMGLVMTAPWTTATSIAERGGPGYAFRAVQPQRTGDQPQPEHSHHHRGSARSEAHTTT
jgi:hypothetical protein